MRNALRSMPVVLFIAIASMKLLAEEPLKDSDRFIDLTHPFDANTVYWPTEAGFKLEREAYGVTEKGYFYSANRFTAAEHGGTHIDAPIHFFAERETVDKVPLWRLLGPGACVDVSERCRVDRDYLITAEDLQAWEEAAGQSLAERIVLLRTGYSRFWPDHEKYLGTKKMGKGAIPLLHFPGLDPVAANWLVTKRNIRAVGIDTASIDRGQSTEFASHVRLCQANVPALENVADLDKLPTHGFTVMALPMKIAGGSGAPCRVVAMLEGPE